MVPRTELHDVLPRVDVLLLALPLDPDTYHLIGARELALLKPSAYLVNIARGPLIDKEALVAALKQGRLAGAGIDVAETEPLPTESGLWQLENIVISPHVGGQGEEAQKQRLACLIADNLRRFMAGKPLENVVMQKTSGWTTESGPQL